MSAIDVHDGEPVGLDDQVSLIQSEYPEMFAVAGEAPKPRKKVARVDGANKPPVKDGGKKMTSAEKLAARAENDGYDNLD
jgi:hypothetical protein